jgi:hypothetical protein
MIINLLGQVDYDIMKSYLPECSEDPEGAAEHMEELINLVEKHFEESELKEGHFHD